MKHWFVNDVDNRLRAGWRILIFVVILIVFAAGGQLGVRTILGGLPRGGTLVLGIIAVAATAAVWTARRLLDKRNFSSLGLTNPAIAWRDLLFGFLLSGLMAGSVLTLMILAGYASDVTLNRDALSVPVILTLLLPMVFVGYWEEIVFRGYLLQNMRDGMGMNLAIVVSCLLYGLVHAANPNASVLSSAIIVLFGYLRIYGYLATGLLWLSIGMHIGWNFFQAPIFGYAASGEAAPQTLLAHSVSGPDWLTGGLFGPEASVLTIPVLAAALLVMQWWAGRTTPSQAPRRPG